MGFGILSRFLLMPKKKKKKAAINIHKEILVWTYVLISLGSTTQSAIAMTSWENYLAIFKVVVLFASPLAIYDGSSCSTY